MFCNLEAVAHRKNVQMLKKVCEFEGVRHHDGS